MNDDTGTDTAAAATAAAVSASSASSASSAASAAPAEAGPQATCKPEKADPLFWSQLLRPQRFMEKDASAASISSLSIVYVQA